MPKFTDSFQSSLIDIADGLLGSSQDVVDSKKTDEEEAENEVNLLNALGLAAKNNITNDISSNEHSGVINQNKERSA